MKEWRLEQIQKEAEKHSDISELKCDVRELLKKFI